MKKVVNSFLACRTTNIPVLSQLYFAVASFVFYIFPLFGFFLKFHILINQSHVIDNIFNNE